MVRISVLRLPSCLLLCLLIPSFCFGQQKKPAPPVHLQTIADPTALTQVQQVAQVEAKLSTSRVKLDVQEVPLEEVARLISNQLEIPVRIQTWALEDVGLAVDTPVTFQLPEVAADTVLRLMLRELDLTYILEAEGIVITTPEEAEDVEQARFYNIEGIVPGPMRDFDSLIDIIGTIVEPESWEAHTGPSSIVPYENGIILKQTLEVHQKIAALLVALEKAKTLPADPYPTSAIIATAAATRTPTITQRLRETPVNAKLDQPSIAEVVQLLAERSGIPFSIDRRALEDIGERADNTIDLPLEDVSVYRALDLLEEKYELTWYVQGEVVVITTPEEAEGELEVRVYPIRDLIWKGLNPDNPQVQALVQATKPLRNFDGNFGFTPWDSVLSDTTLPELPASFEDLLLDAITIHVESDSWEESGGPGAIAYFYLADCLVIAQTQKCHQKVAELLQTIRSQQKPLDLAKLAKQTRESEQSTMMMFYPVPRTRDGEPRYSVNELNAIAKRLQSLYGKGTWDNDAHFIDVTQDRLMIRHRRAVQRQIKQFWSYLGTDDSQQMPWQNQARTGNQPSTNSPESNQVPANQPGGVF